MKQGTKRKDIFLSQKSTHIKKQIKEWEALLCLLLARIRSQTLMSKSHQITEI